MGLNPNGDVAAAEVAFYSPALIAAIIVIQKQGLTVGYFYICALCVLRIVGSAMLLYSETQHDYDVGLLTTAAIFSAVGTAPLLLSLMGFLERMHEAMRKAGRGVGLPPIAFLPMHTLPLIGLALAVPGGVLQTIGTKYGSEWSTGHKLFEAGSIVFFVIYLLLAAVTFLTFYWRNSVLESDKILLWASLASLPFLCVRLAFFILVAFSGPSSKYYYYHIDVYATAFMQFFPEAMVIIIFVAAGFIAPPSPEKIAKDAKKHPAKRVGSEENGNGTYSPEQK